MMPALVERALIEETTLKTMTLEQIKVVPEGKRRNKHDDITVILIPLN